MAAADRELIRRYLLNQTTGAEQTAVEERLFLDPAFFENSEIVEDDLVEDSARGRIEDSERSPIDAFLSSRGRQRHLHITRELQRRFGGTATGLAPGSTVVPATRRSVSSWPALAAAASIVIASGTALYSGWQAMTVRRQMTAMIEQTNARSANIPAASSQAAEPPSLVLAPAASVRGDGTATAVRVTDQLAVIRLQFTFASAEAHDQYAITIERPDGAQVWGRVVPLPNSDSRTSIAVDVPTASLPPDDYTASVSAPFGTVIAGYRFRVSR